jgi:hypothetical protein
VDAWQGCSLIPPQCRLDHSVPIFLFASYSLSVTWAMSSPTATTSGDNMANGRPLFPNSKSFTRLPSPLRDRNPRSRATTISGSTIPQTPTFVANLSTSPSNDKGSKHDIFVTPEDDAEEVVNPNLRIPQSFEELPIELRSLTERCYALRVLGL